jgi:hypothetical protein
MKRRKFTRSDFYDLASPALRSRSIGKRNAGPDKVLSCLVETIEYLEKRGELSDNVAARRALVQETAIELHGRTLPTNALNGRNYLPYWHPEHRDASRSGSP